VRQKRQLHALDGRQRTDEESGVQTAPAPWNLSKDEDLGWSVRRNSTVELDVLAIARLDNHSEPRILEVSDVDKDTHTLRRSGGGAAAAPR